MIIDRIRDKKQFMDLFNERPIFNENFTPEFLLNNPHTYCFYLDNELLGCVFITQEDKKLWLNGFSKRKIFKEVQEAINIIFNHYKQDIYSKTTEKSATYTLLRTGFKKIGTNIYQRRYEYGGEKRST